MPVLTCPSRRDVACDEMTDTNGDPSEPILLSGGNPQIPKGDGDAPVQAYLAAMPGWKRDIGVALDSLISTTVPEVRKAVRWNSPFYGTETGWFLSFHCFTPICEGHVLRRTGPRSHPPGLVQGRQRSDTPTCTRTSRSTWH